MGLRTGLERLMAAKPDPARPDQPPAGKGKLIILVGAAAAAIMTPLVAGWEGKSNDPYRDIVGVQTVCYGETRVEMRRYSDDECGAMLAGGLTDFAGPVLKRNPELSDHPHQLAAATSLAYNIGTAAYSRSTVARKFSAGDWRGACDAFLMWVKAGGKTVKGLVRRREDERRVCLTDLPS